MVGRNNMSEEMIRFAKENYESSTTKFVLGDITENNQVLKLERADIVTPFYCLIGFKIY